MTRIKGCPRKKAQVTKMRMLSLTITALRFEKRVESLS